MPAWIISIIRFFQDWYINDDTLDAMREILDP